MTRVGKLISAGLTLALSLALSSEVRAQSAHGPTRDVVPRGRIGALVWMIGTWDCRVIDRKTPDYATKAWRRVALGPGGNELFILQGMPDFIARTKIGFSTKEGKWYEIDRVGEGLNKQQQTLVAAAGALQQHNFILQGFVPGKKGSEYPLRGLYTWADHNGFVFRAQLLRKDKVWVTFQKQSCMRTDQAPS